MLERTWPADGNRIRAARRALGLTQVEVSKICNFNKRSVENAEAGNNIKEKILRSIAAAVKLDFKDACRSDRRTGKQATYISPRPDNWIYALFGSRNGRPQRIVGCFSFERLKAQPMIVTALGRAYWVNDRGTLSFRGNWHSDLGLFTDSLLLLYYYMESPGQGDAFETPSRHEGVIRLTHSTDKPVLGEYYYHGFVHDLFEWRDNSLSMWAESVTLAWDELVRLVEKSGPATWRKFKKRSGQ